MTPSANEPAQPENVRVGATTRKYAKMPITIDGTPVNNSPINRTLGPRRLLRPAAVGAAVSPWRGALAWRRSAGLQTRVPSDPRVDDRRQVHRPFRQFVGAGDFTLNIAHPRQVGEFTATVHSHYDPPLWVEMREYAEHVKFSPVRNPAGILNSACHSLNALTSEYLQRYFPNDMHNDKFRNDLALYKLTDMTFFAGLADFLKGFFDKLIPVREHYQDRKSTRLNSSHRT